jgi:hypothetical protein
MFGRNSKTKCNIKISVKIKSLPCLHWSISISLGEDPNSHMPCLIIACHFLILFGQLLFGNFDIYIYIYIYILSLCKLFHMSLHIDML